MIELLKTEHIIKIKKDEDLDLIIKSNEKNKLININEKLILKNIKKINIIKNNDNIIILDSSFGENTRQLIEKKIPNIIFNSEFHKNKDYTYQSNSGMDYVIFKLMKEKNIKYGFSWKKIEKNIIKKNLKIIPRIKQNYNFCLKYKIPCC